MTEKNLHQKETARRLWKYLTPHIFLLVVSLVTAALSVAGTLYLPILFGQAVDQIIREGNVYFAQMKEILWTGAFVAV